ncbi:hypothetical protein ACQPZF_33400 [Actinosynnema sp. CS-041913]|uniref:hypothetical protein n=1 Tax=Actinosynnema sp. CS-041913 TaxID=3239917 RepID=UPI003D94380D
MARWVWPTAAGVVTSATGVVINLATDHADNPWTWGGVVLLTTVGVFVGLAAQRSERKRHQPEPTRPAGVHNSVTGTVHGGVVQAGSLGSVTFNSGTTVNQSATAHDGGTIYQAGRDVRQDRGQ